MSTHSPGKVVIVGAGVAGAMTAAYLKAAFGDRTEVVLVGFPPAGEPAGHESTLGDIRDFFDFLGLAEEDWMPACDATCKLAVRVQDWRGPGQYFYLPFEPARRAGGFPLTEWWLRQRPSGRFDRDCFVSAWLCDAGRVPRPAADAGPGADAAVPYGYHLDSAALTRLLTRYAAERGAVSLTGDPTDVRLDARGWIECLVTEEHGEVHGDLFVDCTGERGLLLHRALKVPRVSYRDTLPNDSLVTLEAPADMRTRGIPPYTTVTARGAGWMWTVPLFDRIGAGHAYATEYCTPEEAERALREHVGPEAAGAAAVHTPLLPGRGAQAWKHNCVAVGASAGRAEPLGTVGDASAAHHALERLVRHFPGADWHPRLRAGFNAATAAALDGEREFATLHYQGAARDDTQYWRDAKTLVLPGGLAERLAGWRVLPPGPEHPGDGHRGRPGHAYTSVLIGTGGAPPRAPGALPLVGDAVALREFAAVRHEAAALTGTSPTGYEYLAQLGATSPPADRRSVLSTGQRTRPPQVGEQVFPHRGPDGWRNA
ncbi:tryptophan halogenase family protein [Streptomyces sp. NPDC020571]|uniref:tryptophan halogenase family protein n=1 Tax=Streptomyces sp. NPDC020571 TaxID=3365079 RepID=UPI00379B6D00